MAFIQIIEPDDATDVLKAIYDEIVSSRGKIAEVHKIQSLYPKSIRSHMKFYMDIMYGRSPLARQEREMIATVVSSANDCLYCATHHGEALMHFWKNRDRVNQLINDYTGADINDREMAICQYAMSLTLRPGDSKDGSAVEKLRKAELTDREILDTTMVTGYFNYVNRIVLSLGVKLETDGGSGYSYE